MIIINNNIVDVFLDFKSIPFINKLFDNCKILNDTENKIVLEAIYKKSILNEYDDQYLNIIKNMCLIDNIVICVDQYINTFENRYIFVYHMRVKNYDEIPLIPFLEKLQAILTFELIENNNKTECNILNIDTKYNIDINSYLQQTCFDKQDKLYIYKDISELYKKPVLDLSSYYDNNKDIILNFVTMLLNDCIIRLFFKNIYEYYDKKNILVDIKK